MSGTRLEKLCSEKGLRLTEQRRVIARVLSEADDHPDVDQIHSRALEFDARISIATVYRTLRLLEEFGLLEKHEFENTRSRYEEVTDEHHDHMIDVDSGEVIEFASERIEKLQAEIARELGYDIVHHRLELYVRRKGTGSDG